MNSGEQIEEIFDRALLRERRTRFGAQAPSFLMDFALEELTDRFATIRHDFETICALNAAPSLEETIRRANPNGLFVQMDWVPALLGKGSPFQFVADEEMLPLAAGKLACVVSILGLQLVNDLPGSLVQVRRSLKPDGLFLGATLGSDSFHELRQVLLQAESELAQGVSPRVAPFPEIRELGSLLQRAGFALPVVDSDTITVRYGDILTLMRDLRHMGWANALKQRAGNFLRRDVLIRAGELYQEQFSDPDGRLRMTVQMVWLTGWAPHDSQPKPLKPGSAKMRLSDALGTVEQGLSPGNDRKK